MVLKVVNAEPVSREITAIREECSAGSMTRGGRRVGGVDVWLNGWLGLLMMQRDGGRRECGEG